MFRQLTDEEKRDKQWLSAAMRGDIKTINEMLVEDDARILEVESNYRRTALALAAVLAKDDVVRLLIAHGAKIETRDVVHMTPLILAARYGYENVVATLIEAGADFFVMPSLFEPCGLNQMYSQAYGTVPLVSNVGGLVDTVTDCGAHPDTGTGIVFAPKQAEFDAGLQRALKLFADKPAYAAVQRRAMERDFSWKNAVAAYEQLYTEAL